MIPSTPLPAPVRLVHSRFAPARSILEQAISSRAFPGAAYGVLYRGEFFTDSIGHFTYDPASPAVHPATVYDLASVTKVAATTAVAMLLWQRGFLDLDRPVADLLPRFLAGHAPGSARASVTLGMLLAHSSGLPAYARLFEHHREPQSMLDACLHMPLEAPPLTRAVYSDIGFILLGMALEQITGESLRTFAAREIFTPLAMASTAYLPPVATLCDIPPTLDDTTFRHRIVQGRVHDENASVLGGTSGHAGLFSNSIDLLRFAAAILRGFHGDHPAPANPENSAIRTPGESQPAAPVSVLAAFELFDPATVRKFTTRRLQPAGTSRALGWDTPSVPSSSGTRFSPNSVGHLGYTGTSLWIDLPQQLAVVLLTNRTWPDNQSQAIKTVRPAFHDAIRTALP